MVTLTSMKAKILSLNVAHPREMRFDGKTIRSSMLKDPVAGPLLVSKTTIEGDSFANPKFHGTVDSVLYALGQVQALEIMRLLGRDTYPPGELGENLTLDQFDETEISVGDVFRVGSVVAQATFPRIPCGKVNFRLQHPEGQKCMQSSGRSGVYFRILEPGQIKLGDQVERIERSSHPFLIQDVYKIVITKSELTGEQRDRVLRNGAFPAKFVHDLG